ncbi:MAG: hypothetical protein A2252_00695 [Elusimicrobia bacterium RIFOXYA2_FULL_39_19]|nr:MAG: hypothetical protein A2252_00695 [Elusimicrobia bacterium RIFOXYA2_FULL_39_19]
MQKINQQTNLPAVFQKKRYFIFLLFTVYCLPVMRVLTGSRLLSQDGLLRFFLAFSVYSLAFICSPAYAQWTSIGPGGGGAMYNPMVSPVNSNVMAVNCDMGGYYVTTDNGQSWRMVDLRSTVPYTVFHPTSAVTLFSSGDHLYRSNDAGVNWTVLTDDSDEGSSSGYRPINFAIDPDYPEYMWLANGTKPNMDTNSFNNFKITSNANTNNPTWTAAGTGLPSGYDIREIYIDRSSPRGSRTIYVATTNGMYKSTNGGSNFSSASTGLPSTDIFDMGGSTGTVTTLYVTINGEGVYKSINGGTSWTNLASFPDSDVYDLGISTSPNIVYVLTGAEIYRTTNGGTTWTAVMDGSDWNVTDGWIGDEGSFGFAWGNPYNQHRTFGVSPANPNIAFWTDDGSLTRTDNGGTTWSQRYTKDMGGSAGNKYWKSVGLEVTTTYDVEIDTNNTNNMFIPYTDIGLWRSADAGQSWQYCETGHHNVYDVVVDPSNSSKVYCVWAQPHDIPEMTVLGSAESGTGGFMISNNGGATWAASSTGLLNRPVTSIAVDPASPSAARVIYVTVLGGANTSAGVYKSIDGGATWTAKNTGLGANRNAWKITRSYDGTLYLVITRRASGTAGALYKSTDGGDNWTQVNTSQSFTYLLDVAVHPTNPSIIYMAGYYYNASNPGGVYRSVNGGTSWTKLDVNGETYQYVHSITVDSRDPDYIYAGFCQDDDLVGENYGLFRSINQGTAWTRLTGMPFKQARKVIVNPGNKNQLYATTFGGGVLTNGTVSVNINGYIRNASSVTMSGVAVALTGDVSLSTTTDASGYFEFLNLSTGTYTVTPTKTNWGFNPVNYVYDPISSDKYNQDFWGNYTGTVYQLSGTIIDGVGVGISSVTVTLSSASAATMLTSSTGYYEFAGLAGSESYIITPSKSGLSFTPASRAYSNLSANTTSQDFTGTSSEALVCSFESTAGITPSVGTETIAVTNNSTYVSNGTNAISVLHPSAASTYPGIEIDATAANFNIKNWAGYNYLYVDVYNAGATTVEMDMMFDNNWTPYQRYTKPGNSIPPGRTSIQISLSDVMAVWTSTTVIRTIYMYMDNDSGFTPYTLYYDNLRLTSNAVFSISGYVRTSSGTAVANAVVNITGSAIGSYTTGDSGFYVFSDLTSAGVYTVSTSRSGWLTSPTNMVFSFCMVDQSNQDFTMTYVPKFTISGVVTDTNTVAMENVALNLIGSGNVNEMAFTNSSGIYLFSNVSTGTYTVTPSIQNYIFSAVKTTYTLTMVSSSQGDQNYTGTYYPTFEAGGYILDESSNPVANVVVVSSGIATSSGTTNASGYYVLPAVPMGENIFTPSKVGYIFIPVSTNNYISEDRYDYNFFAVRVPTYTITGYLRNAASVGISGATVTISGLANSNVLTGTSGYYQFVDLTSGTYHITPMKENYLFDPSSRTYLSLNSTFTAQNFIGTYMFVFSSTFSISGYIKEESSAAVSGVTVALSGFASSTTVTDANGFYQFTQLSTGTYGVTPSKTNCVFSVSSLTCIISNVSLSSQNITASVFHFYNLSGSVKNGGLGLEGVTMALTGATNATTATDVNGNYEFLAISTGTYVLTASKTDWSFVPAEITFASMNADTPNQNFTATYTLGNSLSVRNNIFKPLEGGAVSVRYSCEAPSYVSIFIYSLSGDLVCRLVNNEYQTAGPHIKVWDGMYEKITNYVPSGIYLVRINIGRYKETRKVCVVK